MYLSTYLCIKNAGQWTGRALGHKYRLLGSRLHIGQDAGERRLDIRRSQEYAQDAKRCTKHNAGRSTLESTVDAEMTLERTLDAGLQLTLCWTWTLDRTPDATQGAR